MARKFKKNVKERAKLSHDKPEAVRIKIQIEFPWRALLNCHCRVQPGKWSAASEQRHVSICQRQKYWLTLLTYLRASKSHTAEKSSCIMTVDRMIQKDYLILPHHQTSVFWRTLRDGTATAPFLHHPMFSIKYTQFTVKTVMAIPMYQSFWSIVSRPA